MSVSVPITRPEVIGTITRDGSSHAAPVRITSETSGDSPSVSTRSTAQASASAGTASSVTAAIVRS